MGSRASSDEFAFENVDVTPPEQLAPFDSSGHDSGNMYEAMKYEASWGRWHRTESSLSGQTSKQWVGWQSKNSNISTGSFARMSCYIKFLDAVPSASENFGFKFQGQVKLLPKLPCSNCGVFEYTC
jgi:hypothetical protein